MERVDVPGFVRSPFFERYVPFASSFYAHSPSVLPEVSTWHEGYNSRNRLGGCLLASLLSSSRSGSAFPIFFFFSRSLEKSSEPVSAREEEYAQTQVSLADALYSSLTLGRLRFSHAGSFPFLFQEEFCRELQPSPLVVTHALIPESSAAVVDSRKLYTQGSVSSLLVFVQPHPYLDDDHIMIQGFYHSTGVVSISTLFDHFPRSPTLLAHEIGHGIFGSGHCTHLDCLMVDDRVPSSPLDLCEEKKRFLLETFSQ